MGNQPSVEDQPRRPPQKLSKPRVASTNNLLSPNTAASSTARFSNSYVVGPPPAPAPSPEVGDPSPVETPTTIGEAVILDPINDQVEAKPKRRSGLFRSLTLQAEPTSKRTSTGLATSKTFDGITRPKSVVQRHDLSPLSPAMGEQITRRASYLDLPSQDQRAVSPKSPQATSPVTGDFNFDDIPDPVRRDSNQQAMDALLGRSQSEVSLYAPSRRRSAILTPGVATRAEQSETSLSTKKSFRKSLPASNRSRRGSHEPLPERPVSLLPSPPIDDTPERLATPSDNDYKQLGGMKFGSLRITNGVPSPSPGPETGHSSRRNPLSIDKTSLSHVDMAGEIKQPKPVSPLILTFNDTPTLGLETSNEQDYSPFSVPTTAGLTVDSVSPAAHSSVQTTPEELVKAEASVAQDSQLPLDDGPSRSDSGSGSGSSNGSARPSSKADSGYGSSLSLKSLFGSRKKSQRRLKEAVKDEAENVPTQALERRPTLKQSMAYEPLSRKASQASLKAEATAAGEDAPLQMKQSRGGLFNSFRARKARESDGPKHARGASVPEIVTRQVSVDKPTSSSGDSTGSQKTKRLQKLSDNVKRRSLPNMMPTTEPQETVPSMPLDAGEKVQEHTRNFDMVSKRVSLRLESEKEVIRPVVIESMEVPETPLHHIDGTRTSDPFEPVSPQPRSLARPASAIFRPQSTTNTHRRSILRKSKPMPKEPTDSGDEDDLPDYILGVEAQAASIASIRRSAGNSAFDAAFVPMAVDHALDTNIHRTSRQSRSRPRTPEGRGPYPLRSRSSAPDFLETVSEPASPGSISCYSQKKPKTPPPISIRTRGSKKRRRSKSRPLPPQQHPPMPGQYAIEGVRGGLDAELGQSLRSFPVTHSAMSLDPRNQLDFDVPYNRRASARPYYEYSQPDSMGPYPNPPRAPAFHRPSPRGIDSHGRVFQNYNSPAYKGAPIRS